LQGETGGLSSRFSLGFVDDTHATMADLADDAVITEVLGVCLVGQENS
jgi:hypothetical protein